MQDRIRPARHHRGHHAHQAPAASGIHGACGGSSHDRTRGGPKPVKVAVYAFELDDFSAGGAYFAPDARDKSYLEQATAEAARQLAASGRFAVIDTAAATDAPVQAHALRSCSGCLGPITQKLGAEQAVLGIITRINRTEYTLRIQFYEAGSGELRADYFTGLRMGANYAWPRGVASLMKSRILTAPEARR